MHKQYYSNSLIILMPFVGADLHSTLQDSAGISYSEMLAQGRARLSWHT